MIGIDWSFVKQLTTFDGKKIRVETKEELVIRLSKRKQPRQVVIEQECPLSIIYYFLENNIDVFVIDNMTCHKSHLENGTTKTDENDARIIWESSNVKSNLHQITYENKPLQLYSLYHQYDRFMKARIVSQNMKLSYERCYGIGESRPPIESLNSVHPMPDTSPYDISINSFLSKEVELRNSIDILLKSINHINILKIKGLGKRIWIRLAIKANPNNFKNLSSYLRYCGLTNPTSSTRKFNHHAKNAYHLLAVSVIRHSNLEYKIIYNKCKNDIKEKHPDYTKEHLNNACLNRVATFLAKRIFEYGKTNKIIPLESNY